MRLLHVAAGLVGSPICSSVNPQPDLLVPNLYNNSVSFTPASWYLPYQSQWSSTSDATAWIQIDLGVGALPVEEIVLYPLNQAHDYYNEQIISYGFPIQYKVEVSDDEGFGSGSTTLLVDCTGNDQPNPADTIVTHTLETPPESGQRYFRFTASKLGETNRNGEYMLGMLKIEVMAQGNDIALLKPVTVDPVYGYQGWQMIGQSLSSDAPITDTAFITRSPRPMGEGIVINNPENIIDQSLWRPPTRGASTPVSGVSLEPGTVFYNAFVNNIGYLLDESMGTVDKLGNDFLVRAGQPGTPDLQYPAGYWDGYPGSNAARFLMGASNTLRWTNDSELLARVTGLIDIIEGCAEDNGNVMGFPINETFEHQNAGYGRSWLTHGLLATGYLGDERGFNLIRRYYDWFNQYEYVDRMAHGSVQGGQGVVASTLVGSSPIGVPEDIYVVQQYFQENYWRDGLAQGNADLIWQYPYDHPHTYLTTSLEPYFDMYLLTGDERYYDMVDGYWNLFYNHWINIGGSTSIIEFGDYPPDSQHLNSAGELCGSSFWIRVNQRFHWLFPTKEVYVSEIEKSLYNVVMGNQVNDTGLIYHAYLTGTKDFNPDGQMLNTCCEGQGTRSLGSMPEFIYSTDPDSGELFVNLFQSSQIEWQLKGNNATLAMHTHFPFDNDVELTITELSSNSSVQAKLYIRIPSWATANVQVSVNSEEVSVGTPGSYLVLDRAWVEGDNITFTLPIAHSLIKYEGADQIEDHIRYGLMYGPILMAVTGPNEAVFTVVGSGPEALFDLLQPVEGSQLNFMIENYPGYTLMPYWQVGHKTFTSVPVIDVA